MTSFPAWTATLHHDGSPRYVALPAPRDPDFGDEVTIRLRAAPEAPIERVLLRTCPDGEQAFVEMRPAEVEKACRWWSAPLQLAMPTTHYRFLVFAADGAWWYNGA